MLTVPDVASVLGVSRAGAYELAHSEGFPVLKVGSRIVIPKDKFLLWVEKQCGGNRDTLVFLSALCSRRERFSNATATTCTPSFATGQ